MGPCGARVTGPPPPERRRLARALAVYRTLRDRRRRLELRLERRYPTLYDARHAATGIGRALWPLVGPLLAALIVVPTVALLAALVALLGIHAPSIHLPSVHLPDISLPHVTAPGWLRAVGHVIGAVLSVLAPVLKYGALAAAVVIGLRRTRRVRRERAEAERVGRRELLRRLAVVLAAAEARARARDAATVGAASARDARS
jgi:hypothetical protein